MKSIRFWLSSHRLILGIALASVAATLLPALATLLRYQRTAIEAGQWWRLFSAHLVHLDAAHLLLNLLGLGLMSAMFAEHMNQRWQLAALLFSALAVGLGLWFAEPQVLWYVGLSGALHGLFVVGVMGWFPERKILAALVLIGLLAKLSLENFGLGFWHLDAAMPVITAAHRWGAAGGVLFGLACLMQGQRKQHQQDQT